jgi:phosphoribosylformylglycinamidine synthase
VAAVGLVASRDDVVTAPFKRAGDVVLLLGEAASGGARALGGSEWLVRAMGQRLKGEAPLIELAAEVALQKLVLGLARAHLLESAHDVADGGLATTLAECCAAGPEDVGARIELPATAAPVDALARLFGEAPSRVVVSVKAVAVERVLAAAKSAEVPARRIGVTGGEELMVGASPLGELRVKVAEVREKREGCLRGIVGE